MASSVKNHVPQLDTILSNWGHVQESGTSDIESHMGVSSPDDVAPTISDGDMTDLIDDFASQDTLSQALASDENAKTFNNTIQTTLGNAENSTATSAAAAEFNSLDQNNKLARQVNGKVNAQADLS